MVQGCVGGPKEGLVVPRTIFLGVRAIPDAPNAFPGASQAFQVGAHTVLTLVFRLKIEAFQRGPAGVPKGSDQLFSIGVMGGMSHQARVSG